MSEREGRMGESSEGPERWLSSTLPLCRFASYQTMKKQKRNHSQSVVSRCSRGLQLGELKVYGVPSL